MVVGQIVPNRRSTNTFQRRVATKTPNSRIVRTVILCTKVQKQIVNPARTQNQAATLCVVMTVSPGLSSQVITACPNRSCLAGSTEKIQTASVERNALNGLAHLTMILSIQTNVDLKRLPHRFAPYSASENPCFVQKIVGANDK